MLRTVIVTALVRQVAGALRRADPKELRTNVEQSAQNLLQPIQKAMADLIHAKKKVAAAPAKEEPEKVANSVVRKTSATFQHNNYQNLAALKFLAFLIFVVGAR